MKFRFSFRQYLDRHFPAFWWTYPRSGYRLHDPKTYHLRLDPVSRLQDGVRRMAWFFWWSFLWGCVWTAAAWAVHAAFDMPFWPAFGIFVLGSWEGRCHKDQRRALLELRGRESDLEMAQAFKAATNGGRTNPS